MKTPAGRNLQALRKARAWTIEDLASASGVAARTISRTENGHTIPKQDTLARLAAALNTDADRLLTGLASDDVDALVATFACSFCGAHLAQRVSVPHEHGDEEFDEFECGATQGWKLRPCPKDPSFPRLDDYALEFVEHDDGSFTCFARGNTPSARAVDLRHGHGPSREAAERWVKRAFIEARDGHSAAEAAYPFFTIAL